MRIIKVDAISSTNDFVKEYYTGNSSFEPICVHAKQQTAGRGQRGAVWNTKPGENLTFSLLYPRINVSLNRQFLLSATVSLAVLEVLISLDIPKLSVKWPNDILSANQKICGILIENLLKRSEISASIIGVGLNVNQIDFGELKQASSLKQIAQRTFDVDIILKKLLKTLEKRLQTLSEYNQHSVLEEYASKMFRKDKVSTFQEESGSYFNGIIRGVTTQGLLNVEVEDAVFRTFDLKEVKLMY